MTEPVNMKVYELAKELGLDSISLLDKLNTLNIKVKNHMSDLSEGDVRAARESLGKKTSASSGTKKTVARTRKKVAAPETAAPATAPAQATPAKTPAKTKEAAAAAPSGATAKGSPIIRRRVKSDGGTETVSSQVIRGGTTGAEGASAREESNVTEESAETAAFSAGTESEETQSDLSAGNQAEADESSEEATTFGATEASAPTGASVSDAAAGSATQQAPKAPISFPSRPVAPRRSILKIVEAAAPPPRPMLKPTGPAAAAPGTTGPNKLGMKGTQTQDKDGFRIIKMTKENLDQMVEEEAAKKRGAGREAEIRPEDVRFADYRKKEMVFLPKKKRIPVGKELKKTEKTVSKAIKRVVEMGDTITVQDIAGQMNVKAGEVIRKLMGMGTMVTINQAIDFDTATLLGNEYQYEVRNVSFKEGDLLGATPAESDEGALVPRPPVVTIMGHVDHGKTSLLDAIREAKVAAGEAGGITQHIGAYTVDMSGKLITFIDTPGHEAFTVMRARGANVTDIVILVVAADDGVMPQTREALSHAQAAGVPIIVAMNKMDKPGANPEKIKQQLAELNLLAEDWGGQTMFVPVSAIKKTNLDKLLESILLQAEVLDLKANPEARAQGVVLEARLEKGRGAVVSLLVKRGTLKVGDPIVSGAHAGKVKAMMDHLSRTVKTALPGTAVEVLGFEGVPNAGDIFDVTKADSDAREIAQNRTDRSKSAAAAATTRLTLDDLFSKIQAGNLKELAVILKGDVFGSVEAIRDSLNKLSTEKVKVKVIHSAPGGITESDVLLASASNAIIIGFNVRPETKARQVAEAEHVEIKCYSIIYELLDEVRKSMTGLLDKKKVEKFLGRAEVRQTFTVPKIGTIAGSAVIDGKIIRGANVRLLRDSRIIYEGKMSSLRRFKDDAKEVASGFECGIGIENYNDLKAGDVIEAYQIELVTPELDA